MTDPAATRAAAGLLGAARDLVVLTGAGISTESGIPDFRSPGGIWSRYDPTELTYPRFCASAETRRKYWEMGAALYPILKRAQPNRAHHALAELERRGGLRRIITQNVDGLHQPATISFGQAMPERETQAAFADAAAADVFLVVGSSLVVFPAANLPEVARDHGARLVIVNREPTPYDDVADVVLHGSAGEILGAISEQLDDVR